MSTEADETEPPTVGEIYRDVNKGRIRMKNVIKSTEEAKVDMWKYNRQTSDATLPWTVREQRPAYEKAINETLFSTYASDILTEEFRASLKPEWKQVKKLSVEERKSFLRQKETEKDELIKSWKANVNDVFLDAEIQHSGNAVDLEDMWAAFRNWLRQRST